MILDTRSARRFYKLYYLLIAYANDRLHVSTKLTNIYGEPDDTEAFEVAKELWKDAQSRQLIADYVQQNPHRLSRHDLADIAQWEHALSDEFIVVQSGRDTLFICGKYALAVRGITREVSAPAGGLPAFVHTTLLPFDGVIVYAMSMQATPFDMGETMYNNIQNDLRKYKAEGRLIRSAREFAGKAAQIEEEALAARAENFAHEVELDMNADAEVAGQHRGALAGLVGAERAAAVRKHVDERLAARSHEDILAAVRRGTSRRRVPASLRDAYREKNKEFLQRSVRLFGAKGPISSLRKEQLIDRLMEHAPNREDLVSNLRMDGPRVVRDAQRLVEAGGRLEVPYDQVCDLDSVVPERWPLCRCQDTGRSFVTTMLPEFVAMLADTDWDEQADYAQRLVDARIYIQLVVELRGVEYLDEVLDAYYRYVGGVEHAAYEEDLIRMIMVDPLDEVVTFTLYEMDDRILLVSIDLVPDGEVDDQTVDRILDMRADKPARPVSEDMVEAGSVYQWALGLPEAQELMAYLDEHVPDDADDWYFAEDLAGAVVESSYLPTTHPYFLDYMSEAGYAPTEAQLKRFLEFANKLANATPKWVHRGWSAEEFASA